MLQLIIISVYFVAMIIIGVVSRKKARGIDDFFVAGRKGGVLLITGSLLGRYERDGNLPLVQEAYNLFKESVADTITKKLDSL